MKRFIFLGLLCASGLVLAIVRPFAASPIEEARSDDYDGWTSVASTPGMAMPSYEAGREPLAHIFTEPIIEERYVVEALRPCDEACETELDRLAAELVETNGEWASADICDGYCDSWFLFVVDDEGGVLRVVDRDEVVERLGPIDSEIDAMLVVGETSRVRRFGDRFRVSTFRLEADCDPIIDVETMVEIEADGSVTEIDTAEYVQYGVCY